MGVGLSVLIGLKCATLFIFFLSLRMFEFTLLSIPFLYASLVSFLVSIASHPSINLPILLGKGSDGNFPIWSLIIYSPYLYFVRAFSFIRRFTSGEPPYSKIDEGLYVGGWPYAPDKLPPGNPAIVDCTCELPRKREITGSAYLCIPTWDTRSPAPGEIERAVKWACGKRTQGVPVFVHCAYGMIPAGFGIWWLKCHDCDCMCILDLCIVWFLRLHMLLFLSILPLKVMLMVGVGINNN